MSKSVTTYVNDRIRDEFIFLSIVWWLVFLINAIDVVAIASGLILWIM
jgi:hypothetical protein